MDSASTFRERTAGESRRVLDPPSLRAARIGTGSPARPGTRARPRGSRLYRHAAPARMPRGIPDWSRILARSIHTFRRSIQTRPLRRTGATDLAADLRAKGRKYWGYALLILNRLRSTSKQRELRAYSEQTQICQQMPFVIIRLSVRIRGVAPEKIQEFSGL